MKRPKADVAEHHRMKVQRLADAKAEEARTHMNRALKAAGVLAIKPLLTVVALRGAVERANDRKTAL